MDSEVEKAVSENVARFMIEYSIETDLPSIGVGGIKFKDGLELTGEEISKGISINPLFLGSIGRQCYALMELILLRGGVTDDFIRRRSLNRLNESISDIEKVEGFDLQKLIHFSVHKNNG